MTHDHLEQLAERIGKLLHAREWMLASAESCTGGLIGHIFTDIQGCAAFFPGGLVSYNDAVKQKLLDVSPTILETVGSVSAEAACAMARGTRRMFDADIGVATTGNAGPGQDISDDEVGLVFIAVATPDDVQCARFMFDGDRDAVKHQAVEAAFTMLLRQLDSD